MAAHVKSSIRNTWEILDIGQAMQHYRSVICCFPKTRNIRVCDTVTFSPKSIPFPQVTRTDFLKHAASDIVSLLSQPPSSSIHSLQAGDPARKVLLTLATQLKIIEEISQLVTPIIPKPLEPTTASTATPIYKPVTPSPIV